MFLATTQSAALSENAQLALIVVCGLVAILIAFFIFTYNVAHGRAEHNRKMRDKENEARKIELDAELKRTELRLKYAGDATIPFGEEVP